LTFITSVVARLDDQKLIISGPTPAALPPSPAKNQIVTGFRCHFSIDVHDLSAYSYTEKMRKFLTPFKMYFIYFLAREEDQQ